MSPSCGLEKKRGVVTSKRERRYGRRSARTIVKAGVMVVSTFDIVASPSRDCHNTVRELLAGVHRASAPASRAMNSTATFCQHFLYGSCGSSMPLLAGLSLCCTRRPQHFSIVHQSNDSSVVWVVCNIPSPPRDLNKQPVPGYNKYCLRTSAKTPES